MQTYSPLIRLIAHTTGLSERVNGDHVITSLGPSPSSKVKKIKNHKFF